MNNTSKQNIKLTKERIKEEFLKCKNDVVYFVENYCYILSENKLMLFKLYDFQKKALLEWATGKNIVINKGRQMGLSTLVSSYCAWKLIFHFNYDICLISIKASVAADLLKKVKTVVDHLPSWLTVTFRAIQGQIEFVNGSRIRSLPATENAGRSATLNLLVIDEAAFIEKRIIEEIWSAASPTLTTVKGQAIIVSTPKGMAGWFYTLWTRSEDMENDFIAQRLPWTYHPNRDQAWVDYEINRNSLTPKEFEQEYACSFLASGDTIFDTKWIFEKYEPTLEDPISMEMPDKCMWIWEEPIEGMKYLASADTSTGRSKDYSAFVIRDIKLNIVAEYRGKIPTIEYSTMIYNYSKKYNMADLSIENNGVGHAVVQELVRLGYPNLIHTKGKAIILDPEKVTKQDVHESNKKATVVGFSCSGATRPLAMLALIKYVTEEDTVIKSRRFFNELKTLVRNGDKAEAMEGSNDDLCLANAELFYVYETYIMEAERAKARLNAMLRGMGDSNVGDNREKIVGSLLEQEMDPEKRKKLEDIRYRALIEKRKKLTNADKIFNLKIDKHTSIDQREFLSSWHGERK